MPGGNVDLCPLDRPVDISVGKCRTRARAAPAGRDSRSAGRTLVAEPHPESFHLARTLRPRRSCPPSSSQPVSPTRQRSNRTALRATVERCLSHSSTVCRRETAFQVDTVLDQPGNIRGDFPRTVRNEAQIQDARRRRRPTAENQLSVIPVEGYDYPVLRAGDANDVFVGNSGRPLADRNHIVPSAPQTSHAIQRYVFIREQLQSVASPLTS